MPVSHPQKLILVHIPKTGGTSISRALGIHGVDNLGSNTPDFDILFGLSNGFYMQHFSIEEIRAQLPKESKNYFSFAFVRNPFERLVSAYSWSKLEHQGMSFERFVSDVVAPNRDKRLGRTIHYLPQTQFIINRQGEISVDFVGRFECFSESVAELSRLSRIDFQVPHKNASAHDHYRDYYSTMTRSIVEELYAMDLEQLDYQF